MWRAVFAACAAALLVAAAPDARAATSGEPLPVGDLSGWRQLLAEDFDTDVPEGAFPGSTYGSRWAVYPDGQPDTTRRGVQAPRILSVQGGLLTWSFRDNASGVPQVATPLPRLGPGGDPYSGQVYGRYSVRVRSTRTALGYAGVFLLWPDDGLSPQHGEFDFPAGDLTERIRAYTVPAMANPDSFTSMSNATWTSWHTATIEWSPGRLRYLLDGSVLATVTADLPITPMHWVLQTDTTDYGPPPAAGATANLQVDWAAAWAYAPDTAPPRTVIRVGAGACRRRDAVRVRGTIEVQLPSRARRAVVLLGGRRLRRPARVNTRLGPEGLRRILVRYTSRRTGTPRRLTGCRWISVDNR